MNDKVRWSQLRGFSLTRLEVNVGCHQTSAEADRGDTTCGLFICLGFPTACMMSGASDGKTERERESQVEGALLFTT